MTLGPPWFSTTEASLYLRLGLCVTAIPEIETECDRSKTAEDLEKEDHRGERIMGERESGQAFPTDSRNSKTRPTARILATTVVPTETSTMTPQNTTWMKL